MAQLQKLKEIFDQCDADKDGRLKQDDFNLFVKKALNKPCPPTMYTMLCQHFQISPSVGLEWSQTKDVLLQSNNNAAANPPNNARNTNKTPNPPKASSNQPSETTANESNNTNANANANANVNTNTSANVNANVNANANTNNSNNNDSVGIGSSQHVDVSSGSNDETKAVPTNKETPQRGRQSQVQRPVHRFASPQPQSSGNLSVTSPLDETRSVGLPASAENANGETNKHYRRGNGPNAKTEQISELANTNIDTTAGGLTERALKNHEYHNSMSGGDSQLDDNIEPDADGASKKPLHTVTRSRTRIDALIEHRASMASDSGDTSELQILSMMENKLNSTKKELEKEKQKRKQSESLMQQLLQQNDQYKMQIAELQNQLKSLRQDHEKESQRNTQQIEALQAKSAKLQVQVETERTKGTQLESQNATLASERDDAFRLLRKIEKEHESKLQKLKAKHNEELEQVSNGFLQTLGVEAGQDVNVVIKQLKEKNELLQQQVDMLAETLSRKEQSLLEALRAVDDISTTTMDDEKLIDDVTSNNNVQTGRQSVMSKLKNRKATGNNANATVSVPVTSHNSNMVLTTPAIGGHVKKQQSGSWSNSNPSISTSNFNINRGVSPPPFGTDLNASFFKNASTVNRQLQTQAGLSQPTMQPKSQMGKEKQMEVLSKSLATDVAKKQDSIVNLEMANSVLGKQVADLQKQLQDMKQRRSSATPSPAPPDNQHSHTENGNSNLPVPSTGRRENVNNKVSGDLP